MKKHAIDKLREILTVSGANRAGQTLQDDFAYLTRNLTGDELYVVVRLLDQVLLTTHHVEHLPWCQAMTAIRQGVLMHQSRDQTPHPSDEDENTRATPCHYCRTGEGAACDCV